MGYILLLLVYIFAIIHFYIRITGFKIGDNYMGGILKDIGIDNNDIIH